LIHDLGVIVQAGRGLVTISIPKIVATETIQFPAGLPTIILPFEAPSGRFVMQLAMRRMPVAKAS
jgi:hypothetical protein